jgi:serralysin
MRYGANNHTRTSNTSYGFNNNAGSAYDFNSASIPCYCIWDAGGVDTIDASQYSFKQKISLEPGTFSDIGGGISNISIALGVIIENMIGGYGDDLLCGNSVDNVINGGFGDDTIVGAEGNDTLLGGIGADNLSGGNGNDSMEGGEGDDTLNSGAGNDTIDGGAGNDLAQLSGSQSGYRYGVRDGVVIISGADGVDQFTNTERFQWGSAAEISIDTLSASASNLGLVYTKLGNGEFAYRLPDAYTGPFPGIVNQELGSSSGDILLGSAQADFINAGEGDDAIDGGAGNDVIDGGLGSNFIIGGPGSDTFFLDGRAASTSTTWSTITDFSQGERTTIWGYQPRVSKFLWVGSDGAAGYTGVTLHCDLDGNGVIDTSVTFTGLTQAQLPMPSYGTVEGNDYVFLG